jgi:alpha-glucosidase
MYIDHRADKGTHGVFLLNANGMDINIDVTSSGQQYLEYNTIGGVLDFYFFAGPSPVDVAQQSAEVLGLPAMVPYWTYGFHQCKYGWPNLTWVQDVVSSYKNAGIPLEVMWGDIDYMDGRLDFTVDPFRYPAARMRAFIDSLHNNNQKYVMMLDPGIHRGPNYDPYSRGRDKGVFLKASDGSEYRGKQWAGEVVWPDWFATNTQAWWTNEISIFFDANTGLNIDGLWNDMNEVSNFCHDISCNPSAKRSLQIRGDSVARRQFQGQQQKGLPMRNLFGGPYRIANHAGNLSDSTLYTNISNADGTYQYDTHNLYGMMMATASRNALLARRPGKRPFVLSRSTFAGAGSKIAHWFGDNYSAWDDYRFSISQMLAFTAIHQMPFVGSDICGFNGNAEEKMCARWAMLGAFQPFYRNHADSSAPNQEFYRWSLVTDAAKKAIDARYKLLDYMYTALRRASTSGTPVASPLFFKYPNDANTFGIQSQYFFGDGLLVSPVVDDNSQSVTFYLPDDIFYDFWTLQPQRGTGASVTRTNIAFTDIPVHFRGGSIVPMRVSSDMTTTAVRRKNFNIMIAAGLDGKASGSLYWDDGETINSAFTDIQFTWDGTTFKADGSFGYSSSFVVETITLMTQQGVRTKTGSWSLNSKFEVTL